MTDLTGLRAYSFEIIMDVERHSHEWVCFRGVPSTNIDSFIN